MKKQDTALAALLAHVTGLSKDIVAEAKQLGLDPYEDAHVAAYEAYKAGDFKTAIIIYRTLADQGEASAQFCLGIAYEHGQGVPQNYEEAAKWYRMAAEQGHAFAQFSLGAAYATGQGVPQNYEEAAKWYRMAADQGSVSAQFSLGVAYVTGIGAPQNNVLAYMLFSLVATGGDKTAVQNRDTILKKMTPAEIAKGQELAAKWKPGTPIPTSY